MLRADEVAELSRIAAAPATWGHPDIPVADSPSSLNFEAPLRLRATGVAVGRSPLF